MNYIISIINPQGLDTLVKITEELKLPMLLATHAKGTADQTIIDLLGLETHNKRLTMVVADDDATKKLIGLQRKCLYIDAPGNGISIVVPIKSVGGKETLSYLSGGSMKMKVPNINYDYELIIAVANEGHTDTVMNAARSAGATGGTVIHAKGTGADPEEKFFKMSIAQEKEIVLIVAKSSDKGIIMTEILKVAGPHTEVGAIVFSLPVSELAGFTSLE